MIEQVIWTNEVLYFRLYLQNIPAELANLAQVHSDQTDAGDW